MLPLLACCALLLGPRPAQEAAPGTPQEPAAPAEPAAAAPVADDAAPARNLETIFDGALIGAKDGEDFAENPGYRRMLEILSRYGEEELRQKATRDLDVSAALADPDAWRGEFVRVRALLADRKTIRLARPLDEHVDTYRAFLVNDKGHDTQESEGIVVDFLDEPPPLEPRYDLVELEGVFFRTLRFENLRGEVREAPYLIARGIRRFDQENAPRSTKLDGLAQIFVAAAVVFIVARILMSMRKDGKRPMSAEYSSRAIRARANAALRAHPPAKNP